jgi:Holliday junction resolvase
MLDQQRPSNDIKKNVSGTTSEHKSDIINDITQQLLIINDKLKSIDQIKLRDEKIKKVEFDVGSS